jgi:ATP-dependent helicase HrpA
MMAVFPLLPRHSRIIVEASHSYPDVMEETLIAVSFLTSQTPFILPPGEEVEARRAHHRYRDDQGDFISYLRLFGAYRDAEDKQKFCESRYLDPRTMAEIANVKQQLSEIVSEMGIPIVAGGSRADYLCAIARGLIQFVCVHTGKGVYQSLTAERIQIHPGSGPLPGDTAVHRRRRDRQDEQDLRSECVTSRKGVAPDDIGRTL